MLGLELSDGVSERHAGLTRSIASSAARIEATYSGALASTKSSN